MIRERLETLRKLMEERGINAYLIPTADYHGSEYVGDYFKNRQFMTGFTGSAGTLVVTKQEAELWVDGRYHVQADRELKDSGIQVKRMGQEGVPTIEAYLEQMLFAGAVLGFDGKTLNGQAGKQLEEKLSNCGISFSYKEDLVGILWGDRPSLPINPVWILEEKYSGKPARDKIAELREAMKKAKAEIHILTTLEDIMWLLNIRGGDIPCNPVALSYLLVTETEIFLYINQEKLDLEVSTYLDGLGVSVKSYGGIYDEVESLQGKRILLEKAMTNYTLCHLLNASNVIIDRINPTSFVKAKKNSIEVDNERKAHIKDGMAVTKFIYWLKHNIGKIPMSEISVSNYMSELRKLQPGYLGLSFRTISAYGEHAAMCHYSVSEESNMELQPKGLYLIDSGGQYYEGTTDVTRTLVLGELTKEEREHFTLVAMGMLRLGAAKFLYGCRGLNLDYIARELLWQRGLNFDHGTGHGVGYLLSVHERPNGIRWKIVPEREDSGILEEGMITSDEPGMYVEGSHGIRTENLLVCQEDQKTEYGQFMKFEYLTYVPIDLDGIDPLLMEPKDIALLNEYHKQVYEKIVPYLTRDEAEWLKEATREI